MFHNTKLDAREAWLRRLNIYWHKTVFPRFITRIGEIIEVDFGENVGTEFSGRHLAVCLSETTQYSDRVLVIPLTTKFEIYNLSNEDIIDTLSTSGKPIKAGVVIGEARWISKHRIFRVSKILDDSEFTSSFIKGRIEVTKEQLKRWKSL